MPIENICAAGWNPIGDMNSLSSISASDLIWQMDTYYTISYDRCARQWSAGAATLNLEIKHPPLLYLSLQICLDLYVIFRTYSDWIRRNAGYAKNALTTSPIYLHQAVRRRQNESRCLTWFTFSFEHGVWPFSELRVISTLQTHNSYSVDRRDSH